MNPAEEVNDSGTWSRFLCIAFSKEHVSKQNTKTRSRVRFKQELTMGGQGGTPPAEAPDVEQAMPAQHQQVEVAQLPRAASAAEAQVEAVE